MNSSSSALTAIHAAPGLRRDTGDRRYLTVVDAHGVAETAIEYWAGSPDEDEPVHTVVPLRRFALLVGSGERLQEVSKDLFASLGLPRAFFRVSDASRDG